MAGVEKPRRGPHALVLLARPPRVLLGHLPAAERDHPAAVGRVPAVQRSMSQLRVVHRHLSAPKKRGDGTRTASVPLCRRPEAFTPRRVDRPSSRSLPRRRSAAGLRPSAARAVDALQSAVPARSFCLRDCGGPACRVVPCTFGDSRTPAGPAARTVRPRMLSRAVRPAGTAPESTPRPVEASSQRFRPRGEIARATATTRSDVARAPATAYSPATRSSSSGRRRPRCSRR